MSNHESLVWFNKEGDYLNFNYSIANDRFEGDILFHENSSDTYKTYGLYMLEKIPSFDFELPGELTLRKFQLFNEHGLHLYGAKFTNESITKVEPVNNDPNFYSKWIYGVDFESKFPIGTIVKFGVSFLEFINLNKTYPVVATKKGAIMIITEMDNATFENNFFVQYSDITQYVDKTLNGVNAVGVYNYVNSSLQNTLSSWSEPNFYDKYFVGKKLNIVGSEKNDGKYTIENNNLTDFIHFEYSVGKNDLPDNENLTIEVLTRTDLPKVYEGILNISTASTVTFGVSTPFPRILKPGTQFKIIGTVLNDIFLTVSGIPEFNGNVNLTFYNQGDQVIYDNKVYQCVQSYTQSFQSSLITPINTNYWGVPTYVPVEQVLIPESLLQSQIYLTSDRFYYNYGWTYSGEVTLASAAQKYSEDLKAFNIDLFYSNGKLKADLMYSSKYAIVNFYKTSVSPTQSIGQQNQFYEKLAQVTESFNYELNYNYSSNKKVSVVFTDLDEFGIKITINKMVYQEEIAWIYSGLQVDMSRTIDRTLRNWLARNFIELFRLGINPELAYIGSFVSPFYNSIVFKTTYPNVPMDINSVDVGTTANFYIEHSRVLFYDIGPYLNININGDDYGVNAIYSTGSVPDISLTLDSWMDNHSEYLAEFEIYVTKINNLLKFDIKQLDRRLDYIIQTGKLSIPGIVDYLRVDKLIGSQGMLIASNEISLPQSSTFSFKNETFATGMVCSVNNTSYPFNNQEFNIQSLNDIALDLSYQGPFWSLEDPLCNSSAFVNIAFTLGFGQTGCSFSFGPTGVGGPFDAKMFSPGFSVQFNPNNYQVNYYNLTVYPGTENIIDLKYVQLSNCIYGFGDNLVVVDSGIGAYLNTVYLPGNTQSVQLEFNPINNYLYCFSRQQVFIVDPLINSLVGSFSLTASFSPSDIADDLEINPYNGDVYVTYQNAARVSIWSSTNYTNTPTDILNSSDINWPGGTRTGKMVFNEFEGDMYITTDSNLVMRVNGGPNLNFPGNTNRTIQSNYFIPGLTHSIFYEPVNESIYVYGDTSLWKIDNGVTQSVSVGSYPFGDVIFNNLTSEMNVSDSTANFSRLDLNTNISQSTGIANWGYMTLNQFDGGVYLSSQTLNSVLVVNPTNGQVIFNAPMDAQTTRIIYNPDRKSVWTIQPSLGNLVEVEVELNTTFNLSPFTYSLYTETQYGTLSPDYQERPGLWLKTREYLRRPRENFEGEVPVQFYYRWLVQGFDDFFMYDLSGERVSSSGPFAYTGPKPLTEVVLNKLPNKDITRVSNPEFQQTVFDVLDFTLSYLDDQDDFSTEVTPMQTFIGYRSLFEGPTRQILQLFKKEEVSFTFSSIINSYLDFETVDPDSDKRGLVTISQDSTETFSGKGFKPGQNLLINIKDITNLKNQYVSENSGLIVKIREVYTKYLVVDFFDKSLDSFATESTIVSNYPKQGDTTYLRVIFQVTDREIGRFNVYGQTEVEDERFRIELGNVGKLISGNEVFIFKDYDINEGGIDWIFLNKKRKEMLMMKHLIYPYIGSYKSIINAINYFGYNELQLNEYYRNINQSSENFGKLFKVEIPDIFDNTVEGWTENDFIKHTYPNENYEDTNLFNLTYNITDKDGTIVLNYTLDEIIIKLQGLKYWLKKNIIPLTHKILDITGNAFFRGGSQITHRVHDVTNFNIRQNMTPVTFKMNESYLMPVNSGSTVYNCVLDFYTIIPGVGSDKNPTGLVPPPKPFNDSELVLPDYFTIKIRTYKTYKEWAPFVTYNIGDKVTYYGKTYESVINENRVKNPRKFESVSSWLPTGSYQSTNIVEYRRDYFVFSGLGSTQSGLTPTNDTNNWLKITEWKQIDLEPVQTISEYRRIRATQSTITQGGVSTLVDINRESNKWNQILPFNFTVDSNIDPFIVIEVTSDNGYGLTYADKKNYEVRGLKDLVQPYQPIDAIGPFEPIYPVY